MALVFKTDNAASYLQGLFDTPTDDTSVGYLYGWGDNTKGQLGNGTSSATYISEPVKISDTKWKFVQTQSYAGGNNRFALTETGDLYRWGKSGNSYLYNTTQFTPLKLFDTKWNTAIYANGVALLQADDGLYGYGDPWNATLGDPDVLWNNGSINQDSSVVETPVKISNTKWKQITTCGYGDILALNEDGIMYAWGSGGVPEFMVNENGTPANVVETFKICNTKWKTIFNGGDWKCALTEDNKLYSWGYGPTYLFNNGTSPYINHPVQWENTTYKVAAPCDTSLLTIDSSGDMYGCGMKSSSILGFELTENQATPIKLNNSKWKYVTCVNALALAIDENDHLYVWGKNSKKNISDSLPTTHIQYTPLQVGTSTWKHVYISNDEIVYGIRSE